MIVIDIETTGTDSRKHSIVSLGAVDFHFPLRTFYGECKIFDGAAISDHALMINGFRRAQLFDSNKLSDIDLINNFIKWSEKCIDRTLAGMNVQFDYSFLRDTCKSHSVDFPFPYRLIDLHSLAYCNLLRDKTSIPLSDNGGSKLTTDDIFHLVRLPSEPKPHNALTGAQMECEAFYRLIYGSTGE